MIVAGNGHPGVGKLTVGRLLAELSDARLLDAQTPNNLAFAPTDIGSETFQT